MQINLDNPIKNVHNVSMEDIERKEIRQLNTYLKMQMQKCRDAIRGKTIILTYPYRDIYIQ